MTNDELRSVVEEYVRDAQTGRNSEIAAEQDKALALYMGDPLGNEVEGRSHVVSRDVADTVEWIIPSLLRVFLHDDIVVFDPVGPEDEEQASLESLYTNHVIMKQNPGFMTMLTWFKDALLKKVGYVKYWWEDVEEPTFETYTNLTPEQANYVLMEASLNGDPEVVEADDADGLISFKLKYLRKKGRARIQNVPVDEVTVSKDCGFDLQDAACVAHERILTRSELVAMGYDKAEVESLSPYNETNKVDTFDRVDGRWVENSADPAMQSVRLLEAYVKVDYDKDGIAERRRVVLAGDRVLENEEYDHVPFAYLTPIPLPHQHAGLSYTDLVKDLQLIKTALMRSILDNAYLSNNNRWAVNENNVYMEDFLTARPGGVVRTMGDPNRDIVPIQSESIINKALPVVDYIDGVREVRTGVGKITQGLDADVLQNSTASAFDVATSSANQRIEAVARIFAETGVSDLVRGVHELLIKNQDFQTKAKLKEGWTDIDPTQWRHRSDVTVKVGLGNNNDEARKQNLAMLMQVMEKSAAFGIVMPNNAYNFAEQAAKELGFQKRGVFFTDPQSPEYQKMMQQKSQEKNPLVEIEEMKSQVKMMSEQMKQQHQQQKLQLEAMQSRGEQQLEAARAQMDQMEKDRRFALDVTDTELKYATDLMKTGIGAELGRGRA
jgi:hypothetical protein